MFGIGGEELIIIGLIVLIIFGPSKLSSMARDAGRFAKEARRSVDEFKTELLSEEVKEAREGVKEARRSARRTVNEFKSELALNEDGNERGRRAPPDNNKPSQTSPTEDRTDETKQD
jgi:sec-independent protein translocase protein TatB